MIAVEITIIYVLQVFEEISTSGQKNKDINLLFTTARVTTEVNYMVNYQVVTSYLPGRKVSKESTDWWLYAPNWIMGKTMATTECRSVMSAIKELTTIQKKT